jgi:hypothetical protein
MFDVSLMSRAVLRLRLQPLCVYRSKDGAGLFLPARSSEILAVMQEVGLHLSRAEAKKPTEDLARGAQLRVTGLSNQRPDTRGGDVRYCAWALC